MTTEFDQLEATILWAFDAFGCKIDESSLNRLQREYSDFCELLPEEFDPEQSCLTERDPYEQFAHDYVLTRLGGYGFSGAHKWDSEDAEHLTFFSRQQGPLNPQWQNKADGSVLAIY